MSAASRARAFLDMVAAAPNAQPQQPAAKTQTNATQAAAHAAESKEETAQDATEDDDGFIAVGGGGATGAQLAKLERRRLKKKRKQIDRGTVPAGMAAPSAAASSATASAASSASLLSAQLSAIYRDSNASASLDLKLSSYFVNGRSTLRSSDLQSLVLWALGDPSRVLSPRWCFLKNKPLVQRVVLVVIDGVTEGAVVKEHAESYQAAGCFAEFVGAGPAALGAPQPQPIRLYTNHSAFNRSSVLADYLTVPITRDREAEKALAKKKRNQEEAARSKKQRVEEDDEELGQEAEATDPPAAPAASEEMKDEAAAAPNDSDSDDKNPSASSSSASVDSDKSHHLHLNDCLITHEELVINLYPVPQTADVAEFRRSCRRPNCALIVPPITAAAASTVAASDAAASAASSEPAAATTGALLASSGMDWESFPCVHAELAAPAAAAAPSASSAASGAAAAASSSSPAAAPRFFAIDCEMCYTSQGLELSRATLLDASGAVLLDELVQPARPIRDYNTKYSGITAEMLEGVTTTLEAVRARILDVVTEHDVLVGHSLENDLRALRILHRRCIDTALLFTHARGRPFKHSLRALVEKHLGRQIQRGSCGHDPREDALAALELALLKTKHGKAFGEEIRRERESMGALLHKVLDAQQGSPRKCMLIGSAMQLQSLLHAEPLYHAKLVESDEDAVKSAAAAIKGNQMSMVVVQLNAVRNVPSTNVGAATAASSSASAAAAGTLYTQALHRLRAHLQQLVGACRPNTLIIAVSGQASSVTTAGQDNRQGLMWLKIKQPAPPAADTAAAATSAQASKGKPTHAHRSAL